MRFIYTAKHNTLIIGCLLSAVFAYILLRGYYIAFTHDESISFRLLEGADWIKDTANYHKVNSYLMCVSSGLFGYSEFPLRMSAYIGFLLYAAFIFLTVKGSKNVILTLLGFAVLLLNPYLTDFFSLARGYGFSIGSGLLGIGLILKLHRSEKFSHFILISLASSLLLFLSALSNSTFLNLYFAGICLITADVVLLTVKKIIKLNVYSLLILFCFYALCFISSLIIIEDLLKLNAGNQLFYGGDTGMITDTLYSLVTMSFYDIPECMNVKTIVVYIVIILLISALAFAVYKRKYDTLLKSLLLVSILITVNLAQYCYLGSKFPITRTALYYLPVIGLIVYYFSESVTETFSRGKLITYVFLLSLITVTGYHYTASMNLSHSAEWKFDEKNKEVMDLIKSSEVYKNADKKIILSCDFLDEPSMNYYRTLYNLDKMKEVTRNSIEIKPEALDMNADFIYCNDISKDFILKTGKFRIIISYPWLNMSLYERIIH